MREKIAGWLFKTWCKTPRWLALRKWYKLFYGRVGWAIHDFAYARVRDEFARERRR